MPKTKKVPERLVEHFDEKQFGNGAEPLIEMGRPYVARITVEGTATLIMHRWDIEAVDEQSKAAKGSKAKKTDNIASYAHRDGQGFMAIPMAAFCAALSNAARSSQDPRSPRKSLRDLVRAAVIPQSEFARIEPETKEWHFVDRRRMVVQRAAITRSRPAFNIGWRATFVVEVALPQYLSPEKLHELATDAGRLCGLLDSRPSHGRFRVINFKVDND